MENMRETIEEYILAGDFVSAYLQIRSDEQLRNMYAGRIVNAVLEKLNAAENRNSREKVYFYRSVLLWIFRDIPGLAPIYRSQLREGSVAENAPDILKLFSRFSSFYTRSAPRSSEEAAEDVKQTVDGVMDDIKTGKADEAIQDFFTVAGEGLRTGMKGMSDFFDALAGAKGTDGPPDDHDSSRDV